MADYLPIVDEDLSHLKAMTAIIDDEKSDPQIRAIARAVRHILNALDNAYDQYQERKEWEESTRD